MGPGLHGNRGDAESGAASANTSRIASIDLTENKSISHVSEYLSAISPG